MTSARRARRIATRAAYGGGVGVAGIGALGVLGYGVVRVEKAIAHRVVGRPFEGAPDDNGCYGTGGGDVLDLVMLGDSTAAGLGNDRADQSIGARIAAEVADVRGAPVRLTNVAVVGATSADLGVQVANVLDEVRRPAVAVILIGANDITHRVGAAVAAAHLADAVTRLSATGAHVVVGTCPDLGTIRPIPQPLRLLVRRWSRELAAAQAVAVAAAGGSVVALGDLIGPEFAQSPAEMFSADRFHPSPAGYARAAAVLLPAVGAALGLPAQQLPVPADVPSETYGV